MKRKILSFLSLSLITLKSLASIVLQFEDNGKNDLKISIGEVKKENIKKQPNDVYEDLVKKGKIKKVKVSNESETGSKTITGTGG